MSQMLPPDLEQFVEQQLAANAYPSRDDLFAEAVRKLRDTKMRIQQIRRNAQRGLDEIDRGEGIELADDEALADFFREIDAEVDREIAASEAGT